MDPGLVSRDGTGARLGRTVRQVLFASPFYPYTLRGRAPQGLAAVAEDPWPGDPAEGEQLLKGRYRFAGDEIISPGQAPWHAAEGGPEWRAALNGFAWLGDLAAVASDAAQAQARFMVGSWLAHHPRWDPLAWRPDVLARRLVSWLGHAELLLDGAAPEARNAFLGGLSQQARHLARSVRLAAPGPPRLIGAIALVYAGICLPDGRRRLALGEQLLLQELELQVLADGGHASRSPAVLLAVLRDLVALRATCAAAGQPVPAAVGPAIERMSAMLRGLRHGDGNLALFNGTREAPDGAVELTLGRAGTKSKPPASAPQMGFERLTARRSVLLIDVGAPRSRDFPAHAGTLSFEFSVGRDRLIVNCGAAERPRGSWARAMRATAAHSTLVVADRNAFDLDEDGRLTGRAPAAASSRSEAEGSTWLEASHDGYARDFGLVHRRRLYLDSSGEDLRGEDTLLGTAPPGTRFSIRFHLHPQVQASMVQNGVAVLLKLPHGAGFSLRAAGGTLALEESVYLGSGTRPRRSEQIVISGVSEGAETSVKWAITRLQAGGPAD